MVKIVRNISLILLVVAFSSLAWFPVRAEELTCPDHTPVLIDIKPGSFPNSIQLASNGLLPVAVITTSSFDAALFNPEMAHLSDANTPMNEACSGAMAVRWVLNDVNRDGKLDMVFFFQIQELNLSSTSTAATLMAHGLYDGVMLHIIGTDSVRVVAK